VNRLLAGDRHIGGYARQRPRRNEKIAGQNGIFCNRLYGRPSQLIDLAVFVRWHARCWM
jgi:hypothetical protein